MSGANIDPKVKLSRFSLRVSQAEAVITVIPEHANQVSTTTSGAVIAGTRVERFISQVGGAKVIVPLSGVPISCDGEGHCTQ